MKIMNPQEWSRLMTKEICKSFEGGNVPRETALQQMFSQWIAEIVAGENKNLLDELTNLAFKETDSGKRAGYFKMARMVQARINVNAKSSGQEEAAACVPPSFAGDAKEMEMRMPC